MITTDVFIAGAGIAGSIAALSYAKSARNVIVADPISYEESSKFDYRTTAYLQPSKLFLELLGVWDFVKDSAMPLEVMKIIQLNIEPNEINKEYLNTKKTKSNHIFD